MSEGEWRIAQYPEGFYVERRIRGRHYEPIPLIFETLDAARAALRSETAETVDIAAPIEEAGA